VSVFLFLAVGFWVIAAVVWCTIAAAGRRVSDAAMAAGVAALPLLVGALAAVTYSPGGGDESWPRWAVAFVAGSSASAIAVVAAAVGLGVRASRR